MRLWVLSDLHLGYAEAAGVARLGEPPEADICVMAGDLCRSMSLGMKWLARTVRDRMPVVYVPGNHDFYDTSLAEGSLAGRAAAEMAGVTMLQDDEAVIGGVRFVGGTLWADYALNAPRCPSLRPGAVAAAMEASRGKSDYRRIRLSHDDARTDECRPLAPEDTVAAHGRTLAAIEGTLAKPFPGPTVVVTHHAPHPGSVDPRYAAEADPFTPSYVSDLSDVIGRLSPTAWVHGHVHQAWDYAAGKTRIVCNPKGYAHETPAFEWGKTVTV